MNAVQRNTIFAGLLLALAACGGIEGTGSPQAGIEGSGFTEGTASGFGSVYVNGVRFATDQATILVDGVPAGESALQLGMVLAIDGDIAEDRQTGVARRIITDRLLFGPVEAVDVESHTLVVLGQLVCFDDHTVFEGLDEGTIQPGDLVFISGHFNSDGLLATRVQRESQAYVPGTTVVEVEGTVRGLTADRFQVGSLEVAYAAPVVDSSQGPLIEGARVEVRGRQASAGGTLDAERVTVRPVPPLPDGLAVSLEGVIQQFVTLADFTVNGRRVDAHAARRTDDTALQPAVDLRIRLVGTMLPDGRVLADEYALMPAGEYSMTGRVKAVDQHAQTVSVFSQPQQAQADTQYQDRQTGDRRFRLDDVQLGDFVELRGFTDQAGRFLLTRIERREPEQPPPIVIGNGLVVIDRDLSSICIVDCTARRVRGPLRSADNVRNRLVIAGVIVATNPATTRFKDRDGNDVNSVDFYSAVRPGDRLVAEGKENNENIGIDIDARLVRYAMVQF